MSLSSWIQPRHLTAEAAEARRAAWASCPASLTLVEGFLLDDRARSLSEFLAREGDYRCVRGVYSHARDVDDDAWRRVGEDDRFYRLHVLQGVKPDFRLSPNLWTYLRFVRTVQSDGRALFEAYTGCALGPAHVNAHALGDGDFLRPHTDDIANRQLAFVLFLSADWTRDRGGVLTVRAGGAVRDVCPTYNTLALFDVTGATSHDVSPVTPAAGASARFTISGWFERGTGT